MAAQTLVTNLTVRSTSFDAGMKNAAKSAQTFGSNITKVGGGLAGMTGLMGQSIPGFAQFSGMLGQAGGLMSSLAQTASKSGLAMAGIWTGIGGAAVGVGVAITGIVSVIDKANARMKEQVALSEKYAAIWATLRKEVPQMAQGTAAEKFIAMARDEMAATKDEGFWDTMVGGLGGSAAAKRAELQKQIGFAEQLARGGQEEAFRKDEEKRLWAGMMAEEKAAEDHASWQRNLKAKLADEAEAARQKEEKQIWEELKRQEKIEEEHLELVLRLKKEAYVRESQAQEEADAREWQNYDAMMQAREGEGGPIKGGGAARMIDTSRISLEGLRMNTEPINEAKKGNALLQKIDAKLGVMANDKGFFGR